MKDSHSSPSNPFPDKNDGTHDSTIETSLTPEEITAMTYAVPLIPLPISLKSRLLERLNQPEPIPEWIVCPELQELLQEPIEKLVDLAHSLEHWKPLPTPSGAVVARWKVDPQHRQVAFFLKVPNPGILRRHRHATGEIVVVLEGDFTDENKTYRSGDRSISQANTIHQPTTQGCLVLCISSLDDQVFEA